VPCGPCCREESCKGISKIPNTRREDNIRKGTNSIQKRFWYVGYHQGVQKQNCLKMVFIMKVWSVVASKRQMESGRLAIAVHANHPSVSSRDYKLSMLRKFGQPNVSRSVNERLSFELCASDGSACCSVAQG
jgi:hypothetical protein